jgi:hypothetical protein
MFGMTRNKKAARRAADLFRVSNRISDFILQKIIPMQNEIADPRGWASNKTKPASQFLLCASRLRK